MSGLAVLSVGASTPLGLDARQTALLLRASKGQPRTSSFRASDGNTIGTIRSHRLDDGLVGYDRYLRLAKPALEEALLGLPVLPAHTPTVLLLNLPKPYEGEDPRLGAQLLVDIGHAAKLTLDPRSIVVRLGHAGFAALLARAATFGADTRILVGAVDTYHERSRITSLDAGFQIFGKHASKGFIPSEGASFACVSPVARRANGREPLAVVKVIACGEEPEEEPPMARSLTKLLRDERLPQTIDWMLWDLNGDERRQREWSFSVTRNLGRYQFDPEKTRLHRPYDEIGELGAATGAIYLCQVCMAFQLGFAPSSGCLIVTSSDGPERGVLYVEEVGRE